MTARRSRVRLTILVAALGCLATAPAQSETAGPPPPGAPAPNFALTTQQNDRLWLTQLRGRAVALFFGCTGCGVCPGLISRMADVAHDLGDAAGRSVFFALVTVDPARDTAAALREFGRANGLRAPAWILLTEDRPGQIDVVTRRYGVAVRRADGHVEADCAVTLIDAAGRIRARYEGASLERLESDLRALLGRPASP